MNDVDPWNDILLPRDRYGRPLIINPDSESEPYTRVSTFCSTLSDSAGIAKWKLRHLAIAMGRYRDLGALAAGLSYEDDKADLDDIIDRALDRVGLNLKADYGTAIHTFTEPGRDEDNLPDVGMLADVRAYNHLMADLGIEVAETEMFVVNDEFKVAGTFDHIYEVPRSLDVRLSNLATGDDGDTVRLIGDKKTGQLHLHEHALQLALYAGGCLYNPATGERYDVDVSQRWGLAIHVPRGEARAVAYLVDLYMGHEAAVMAANVREWRKVPEGLATVLTPLSAPQGPIVDPPRDREAYIMQQVELADSKAELSEIWREYRDTGWTVEHTEAAKVRALLFDDLGARVVASDA